MHVCVAPTWCGSVWLCAQAVDGWRASRFALSDSEEDAPNPPAWWDPCWPSFELGRAKKSRPCRACTRRRRAGASTLCIKHEDQLWRTVDAGEVLERVGLIDAPRQQRRELRLQRREFSAYRQKLDEIKKEAQHVATCMRRIQERLHEGQLHERGGLCLQLCLDERARDMRLTALRGGGDNAIDDVERREYGNPL